MESNPQQTMKQDSAHGYTDNELIARWMGGEIVKIGFRFKDGISRGFHLPQELRYNTSWDWLMPVVEKIRKIDTVRIKIETSNTATDCAIYKHAYRVGYQDYPDELPLIELVYRSVVSFIKWHNQQSK